MNSLNKALVKILFLLIGTNTHLLPQWTQYGPFNNQTINDVVITNQNFVFVAPLNKAIYMSPGISDNWTHLYNGLPSPTVNINKILVVENTLFINGGDGIYRFIEEANLWEKIFSNTLAINLHPIGFINGIIFAKNSTILPSFTQLFRSTNFGIDWVPCDSGLQGIPVNGINYFAGEVYITTGSGVFTSTDFGDSWFSKSPDWNVPTQRIASNSSALLVTSSYETGSRSYLSVDSGQTWNLTHEVGYLTVSSIGVFHDLLLRGSFYGGIEYSSDNGSSWGGLYTTPWHTATCIASKGDTLILGEEYYSHEYGTGGIWVYFYIPPSAIRSTETSANSFFVSNNYPNPFNPTTKIVFTVPSENYVQIRVFNSLGEEVATLLNEKRAAGSHEVEFNGTNSVSGIYFCRIVCGNYSEIRKMVLIR